MRGWDELREEYGNIYTNICKSSAKRKMYSSSKREIYICKCTYLKRRFQINNLILHLKEPEKEQTKPKASRRNEITKIREERSKTEKR